MTSISAPPLRKTVRTRICMISDTHCSFPKIPPCDLLIHSGDLTANGRHGQLASQLRHIASAPAELKLVIPGNHDITLDRTYYARMGRSMHKGKLEDLDACADLWTGELAKGNNVMYLQEGMSVHALSNGARFHVYSSPYQPEFCDWAFPYFRHEDRFNATPTAATHSGAGKASGVSVGGNWVPDFPAVDLMITHGPPIGILDRTVRGEVVGCENLMRAVRRARPLLHCFGHIHEGWGAGRMDWGTGEFESQANEKEASEQGKPYRYFNLSAGGRPASLVWGQHTEFVNASIMNVRYQPVQLPFLVDLDLPIREDG